MDAILGFRISYTLVAPQCAIPDVSFTELFVNKTGPIIGRVPFTTLRVGRKRNYIDIHLSANYEWIVTEIKNGFNGYVKNRN